MKTLSGQCHCGAVKFLVRADAHLVAWDCNCSICSIKRNIHFVVPSEQFTLLPLVPAEERVNFDDALAAAHASPYPAHWGRPPQMQTRDLVPLPGGYGKGSGTLAKWIQEGLDADEAASAAGVEASEHGAITTYTYNTHTAKHTFCSLCGVCSFYCPRSNPAGVGITLSCLVPAAKGGAPGSAGDTSTFEVRIFDGQNWEDYIEGSGIKEFSGEK